MKKSILTNILVILIILLISLISFIGIYVKDTNIAKNIIPEYLLGMNLSGSRVIKMDVDLSTKKVVRNSEGKISEDGKNEDGTLKEGYTEVEEKVNPDEKINKDNFEISKKIVEKRLEKLGVKEYVVRQNTENGSLTLEIPEDNITEDVITYITYVANFEIQDSDTKEVLMDNSQVKTARVVYGSSEYGTTVYLQIEFNKEGKSKLEEITNTYTKTTNEAGEEVTKNIEIKIDDDTLVKTYFSEKIDTGKLPLSIGSMTTSSEEINEYTKQANLIATLISAEEMPLEYDLVQNRYIQSAINEDIIKTIIIALILIVIIALIYLIIKYKTDGIISALSFIGFIGALLLIIRYANVIISLEAIVAILTILVVNFCFINYILKKKKEDKLHIKEIINQAYTRYVWIFIPLLIIAIVFTFMSWIPITSIGMVMFWGLVIFAIYNLIITRTLLLNSSKE